MNVIDLCETAKDRWHRKEIERQNNEINKNLKCIIELLNKLVHPKEGK
jgi:hypothetical protein